jgi:hypothetical protein
VFDLIEQENVKVTKDQLSNILNLLEKEKLIEAEETKTAEAAKVSKTGDAQSSSSSSSTVPK